jgi:DNA-binding IclR family transcriptional regulator
MPARNAQKATFKLETLAFALGSVRRWKLLIELGKGEPLPVSVLARRAGLSRNGASKVLNALREGGILERGYGNLYRIPAHFLDIGKRAIDFGQVIFRLDPTPAPSPEAQT